MGFLKETLNPFRILGIVILIIIIVLIGFLIYMVIGQAPPASRIDFGVTFSKPFAQKLGLDWREAYLAILDDLKVRKLRLVAYWPEVEPNRDSYSFEDLDWQINQASQKGTEVILAVGRRLPRWPECHIPDWAANLSEEEQQEKILILIDKVVNRYKDNLTIKAWQIENEPFLRGFGECPPLDVEFLDKEIALVRQLDFSVSRPIIISTSGELSSWISPAKRTDILGTTLYRTIWKEKIGYFKYPIPPVFYYKRANLVKKITGVERTIIVELQAEPWGPKQIYDLEPEEQAKSMNLEKFKEIISYTRRTGFDEAYLWGVEWWYQRNKQGNGSMWNEAKKLWDI